MAEAMFLSGELLGYEGDSLSGIYCILNMINGHFYIGSTYNFYERREKHRADLNANRHINRHLQSAWNKYGGVNFQFIVIQETDIKHYFVREQEFLDLCWDDGVYCYNIAKNVEKPALGVIRSEETRLKISIAQKNSWTDERRKEFGDNHRGEKGSMWGKFGSLHPRFGIKLTEEQKQNLSEKNTGIERPHSLEHTKNLSNAFIGRRPTEETLNKIKESRNNRESPRPKGCEQCGIPKIWNIILISPEGQEFFVAENLTKFAKENNLNPAHMKSLTNGKRKYHKGWTIKENI